MKNPHMSENLPMPTSLLTVQSYMPNRNSHIFRNNFFHLLNQVQWQNFDSRSTFYQIPDGMCIDAEGMLWVALFNGGKVRALHFF